GSGLSTWWLHAAGRRHPRPLLLGLGLVAAACGIALFAATRLFAVFAIAAFLTGLAAGPAFTLSETLLQEATEARQRGRVFSARDFLVRLVFLMAVTVAGASTRALGVRPTLFLGALLVAAAGVAAIAWGNAPDRK